MFYKVSEHQGLTLSPLLFAIIIDKLFKFIWGTVSWCMLYVDNIVLDVETSEEANSKLEE